MMMPPGFAPSFPGAPPAFAAQPAPVFQPARWPQQQAVPPSPALAQGQPPARVVRGQAPEEPHPPAAPVRPAPLTLPPPEALGVAAARPAEGDALQRRLEQLGA